MAAQMQAEPFDPGTRYARTMDSRRPLHTALSPLAHTLLLHALAGCPSGGDATDDDTANADDDTTDDDTADDDTTGDDTTGDDDTLPWGDGDRAVSGRAYFFDMPQLGQIQQMTDVQGAEVHVFEAPQLSATLEPADDHAFRIEGIPEGAEITLALTHPDYFPGLTGTWSMGTDDLEGLTFQAVTNALVELGAVAFGVDPHEEGVCQMATTVTAISDNQDSVWAVGEPGATVTLDPAVPPEAGPLYFNEMVLPDLDLTETSTDGGVLVIGAEPGSYTWSGHKDGLQFNDLTMRCEEGWLTNASPPWAMQASLPK